MRLVGGGYIKNAIYNNRGNISLLGIGSGARNATLIVACAELASVIYNLNNRYHQSIISRKSLYNIVA